MIPTIFGFLLICMAIQAFGYIIGMGAVAVKEVQAHHQMGKDPLVAGRRARNNKKAAKFCFWMFLGMIAFAVLIEWLKAQ